MLKKMPSGDWNGGGGAAPANLLCQIGAALAGPRSLLLKLYRYKIRKELSVNKNHSISRIYREYQMCPPPQILWGSLLGYLFPSVSWNGLKGFSVLWSLVNLNARK